MANDILRVELVNGPLIEGVAAGLGLLPIPQMPVVKTDNENLLAMLEEHGGPTPFFCCSTKPGFYQRGISRITNSVAQHTGLHVGTTRATIVRAKHPDLFKPRRVPNTTTEAGLLPPVPEKVEEGEIIESQVRINTNLMRNVVREGEQVVAFVRDWTDSEIDAILYAAYFLFGAPYDIFEIGTYLWPWMFNPNQLKVCSTFVAGALDKGDDEINRWLREHGGSLDKCAPGHVGRYLFDNPKYTPVAFNCSLSDARRLV